VVEKEKGKRVLRQIRGKSRVSKKKDRLHSGRGKVYQSGGVRCLSRNRRGDREKSRLAERGGVLYREGKKKRGNIHVTELKKEGTVRIRNRVRGEETKSHLEKEMKSASYVQKGLS